MGPRQLAIRLGHRRHPEPASQGQCPVQIELGAGTKAEKIFPIRPARPRAARRAIKGLAGVCLRGDKRDSRRKRRLSSRLVADTDFEVGDQFSHFSRLAVVNSPNSSAAKPTTSAKWGHSLDWHRVLVSGFDAGLRCCRRSPRACRCASQRRKNASAAKPDTVSSIGKIRCQRPKREGGDTKALTLPARISGTIDVQPPRPPAPTLQREVFMAEPFPVGLRLYLDRPFVSANDN